MLSPRSLGITVVIPTLDRPEMLRRAYESVSCKSAERVEILIVDDGSKLDLRPNIPLQNQHRIAIRSFRFDSNRGPQAARNLGIRRARFSHIAFLDSDDAFAPGKIDRLLAELDSNEVDLLFHGVDGMPKYARLARLWSKHLRRFIPFGWWVSLLNPVVTPALVVRRRVLLGVPSLRHCEDWAFLLRYVQPDTRVQYLDEDLTFVYRAPGSLGGLSAATWRMRQGEFKARLVLLKRPSLANASRFVLGNIAGALRVLNDLLRGRYLR